MHVLLYNSLFVHYLKNVKKKKNENRDTYIIIIAKTITTAL